MYLSIICTGMYVWIDYSFISRVPYHEFYEKKCHNNLLKWSPSVLPSECRAGTGEKGCNIYVDYVSYP